MEQSFTQNAIVLMAKIKKIVEKDGDKFVETNKDKLELTVLKESTDISSGIIETLSTENDFSDNVIVDEKLLEKFKFGDKISYLANIREYQNKVQRKIVKLLLADGKTWLNGKPAQQDLPF